MVLDARPEAAAPRTGDRPVQPPTSPRAPRLAEGVELLGEYEGSGFKKAPYIARRADGQTIQLSQLLYAVAEACDGRRTYDEIAVAASESFGRRLSARNAKTLVDEKLNALGIVVNGDGSQPVMSKPEPLLALRMRKGVLPPKLVKAMTTVFYPAFFPPVVIAAVVALGVFDWWLFVEHGVAQGVRETLLNPTVFLLMFGVVIASAFFHEVGHATGLRYGGGEPGVMGAGVYIAFPAFYTDVTDAYRLSKGGRLRTDLGGVYFNALFMLATAGVYFATGFEPLLALILVQHIEMAHQFLPFLRLDGYYIVADAVGVPDLFTRIGPILKSMIPGRKPDARVTALKPWVRFFVSAWVLVVVPFLLFNLGMLLVHLPRFVATGVDSAGKQLDGMRAAFGDGNVAGGVGGILQLAVLVLPFVGIAYTLFLIGARIGRRSWAWSADSALKRVAVLLGGTAALALLAAAWLPGKAYRPIQPGERGTFPEFVASSETVLVERSDTPAFTRSGTDKTPDTPTLQDSVDDNTAPVGSDPVTSPAPVESAVPTSEPVESASPEPSASMSPEPSATMSPEPTATVAP